MTDAVTAGDGKAARARLPRRSHGDWSPAPDRPDPVDVVEAQNAARLQFLVPVRRWRMSQSPFAFYRGAAAVMAADLAALPTTGHQVQLCGDAHVSNFGAFGSPERDLVFDVNDFDETLPGPWEWDVKRLAASLAIAARHHGHADGADRDLPRRAVGAYRDGMRTFAEAGYLDTWYAHLDLDEVFEAFDDQLTKKERKRGRKFVRTSRAKNSAHAYRKLAEQGPDGRRLAAQPPLIIPLRDFPLEEHADEVERRLLDAFEQYLDSLPDHRERLLRRYRYRDLALKVVGVGSVGTRCWIMLLEGRDADDPLFLQIKEATRSVLEDHLPASDYAECGRRVVEGQRLMQAVSDSFLGWHTGDNGIHYYWRQFKDMKGSIDLDIITPAGMERLAGLCGWTLARAHARSGGARFIADYLGSGDNFDHALAEFAVAYADQNELDHAAFVAAIADGRLTAHE